MSVALPKMQPPVPNSEDLQREPIGVRLRRLRLQRGFSQRELSSPGVSYAYISRIEAGARTPSVKALRMLAAKLGVSVEYLETGQDLRAVDERELRLADAELELRLAEDVTSAERKLVEIHEEARRAGDVVSASRAQIALGLAAAHRGNHLDAVERLEAALEERPTPVHTRQDLFATLGQSYAALGAPERAVRLFERCLAELTETAPDDNGAYIRFATFLSYAHSDAGDYERAKDVVREALQRADDATDPYSRVRLHWSLARVAGMEGRSADALEHIRRAIALLENTDHNIQLARAYLLSAGIESSEGHAAEARRQLVRAEQLLGSAPEHADLGMLRIGQSRVAALEGDAGTAVPLAREALDLLGDFHGGEQGAAVAALAEGLALQGDATGANDAFRRAVDLLTVHGRRHDASESCLRWGQMLEAAGRTDEADAVRRRAADLAVKTEVQAARKP